MARCRWASTLSTIRSVSRGLHANYPKSRGPDSDEERVFADPFKYFPGTRVDFDDGMERHRQKPNRAVLLATYRTESEAMVNGSLELDLNLIRQCIAQQLYVKGFCDIMGRHWPSAIRTLGESRGPGWQTSKQVVLTGYALNIALENTLAPYYVTEKIWDAIVGACLPIYYSTEGIYSALPRGSFVDVNGKGGNAVAEEVTMMAASEREDRYAACLRAYIAAEKANVARESKGRLLDRTRRFLEEVSHGD